MREETRSALAGMDFTRGMYQTHIYIYIYVYINICIYRYRYRHKHMRRGARWPSWALPEVRICGVRVVCLCV